MSKVYVGVGHGGTDSGAVGYLVEKDINLKMATACKNYLEKRGVEVLMARTADTTISLTELQNVMRISRIWHWSVITMQEMVMALRCITV